MSENGNAEKGQTEDRARSVVEWVTLAVSALILLALAGLIVYESLREEGDPPVIVVEADFDGVREAAGHFYLPVTVWNEGGRTAEAVEVAIRLGEGAEMEQVVVETQFLPGGGSFEGVAVFERRPEQEEVGFVASFVEP